MAPLEDWLTRATEDPGSITPRQPDEPLPRWTARAVSTVLNSPDGPFGKIRAIHTPWGIYTECGHEHTDDEAADPASTVREVDLVGLVCDEGLLYRICKFCCVEPGSFEGFQTETCSTRHTHTPEGPVCPSVAILDDVEMPDADRWT